MKLDKVFNNEFVKEVLDNSRLFIESDLVKGSGFKKRAREKMSREEKFVVDVFLFTNEIISKLQTLGYCFAFLNSYPKTQLWEKTFKRTDYIKYHLENYYKNITGLFDRCLLLVNFVYDLGIKEKYVGYELIKTNKHIKSEPVKKVLVLFNNSLKGIKSLRNYIEHQGSLSDEELSDIGMYELIIKSKSGLSKEKRNMIEAFIKMSYSNYLRTKKKEVKGNNKQLTKLTNLLFSAVKNKYIERISVFEDNDTKR